ncbi:MAG: (d)CMP kinase [Bacteroidetes bacterium]|nr:(d)CMP kinase [Bacteroidota bacterium]MBU1678648.1 (d)CMP kinase [Bacteroidota bacterium]
MSKIIIAIDGPAASGKSTAAKFLAEKLGFTYLDTGAMYRAITYLAIEKDITDNQNAVIDLVRNLKINLRFENGITKVFIDGKEVTDFIRSKDVNASVSKISKIPEVRSELVKIQQKIANNGSIVAEGRDTTTVVFPNADVKIYLTAKEDVRANRRLNEYLQDNIEISFEEVKNNLHERDKIDSSREVSPLTKSKEAIELDTTGISVEEELEKILEIIDKVVKEKKNYHQVN